MEEKTMRKIEDRVTETKSRSFCPPTNEAVVKAWEAFDKRVVAVYDPDTDVEIERGSRQVFGIGGAGDIIRGIDMRKDRQTMECDLDAWMKVSDFMGDVFPQFVNPDEDKALLIVDEWNNLMDSIADDEDEATPEIRQAAEDQKIVALGRQNSSGLLIGMEVYDDGADMGEILRLRKYDPMATIVDSYTSPAGVNVVTYAGWTGNDEDEIVYPGGWWTDAFDRSMGKLSEYVRDKFASVYGGDPVVWNNMILGWKGEVSPRDAELLEALWIGAEVYKGKVTIYGTDDDLTRSGYSDFEEFGLSRIYSLDPDLDLRHYYHDHYNALDR